MTKTDRKVFAICFGAAVVFWLILNLSQDYTVRRTVNLEYLTSPDRVLIGTMPSEFEADISGQGWTLIWESLRPGPLPVTINIREGDDNRLTTEELRQEIQRNLSSGALTVGYMDFQEVPILTTPLAGKRVPIIPDIRVTPAPGFVIVDSLLISPDSVTISAANDVLDDITTWRTIPLDLNNVNGLFEDQLPLVGPEEGITLGETFVRYNVRAEPFIQRQIDVPVTVINVPPGERYEITPRSVTVTASVPQSIYGRLDADRFRVEADVSELRDGSFSPSIALRLRETPPQVVSAFLDQKVATYYAIR